MCCIAPTLLFGEPVGELKPPEGWKVVDSSSRHEELEVNYHYISLTNEDLAVNITLLCWSPENRSGLIGQHLDSIAEGVYSGRVELDGEDREIETLRSEGALREKEGTVSFSNLSALSDGQDAWLSHGKVWAKDGWVCSVVCASQRVITSSICDDWKSFLMRNFEAVRSGK